MFLIKNIQKKPKHVRITILWISVIICAVLILVLWLIYLNSYLRDLNVVQKEKQVEEVKESSSPSLFSILKGDLFLFKSKLQAGLKQMINPLQKGPGFEVEIIK